MSTSVCKCGSDRILEVSAKCSDMCCYRTAGGKWVDGYVPSNKGIGPGGDYLEFELCLSCGVVQGQFPIPERQKRKK